MSLRRFVVLVLVGGILLTPIVPAFAQEATTEVPSAEISETVSDEPAVSEPAVEEPVPSTVEPEEKNTKGKSSKKTPVDNGEKIASSQSQSSMAGSGGDANSSNTAALIEKRLNGIDQTSGAFVYDYPIEVPPGRNSLQPQLKLSYNSQNTDDTDLYGYGWSDNIPYIIRSNKKGANQLYSQTDFYSSLSGELIDLGSGNFGSKVENGEFLNYSLTGNVWTVKDKMGVAYKFGTTTLERQDNPGDPTQVFKWMLQEVRDTNDNYVKYTYFKDVGQIYPSQIIYTGNGSTDGVFTVNFIRSTRTDVIKSYKSTFLMINNYKITEINTAINGNWNRKFVLSYTIGDNDRKSILQSITASGKDESGNEIVLPNTSFVNQESGLGIFPSNLTLPADSYSYFNEFSDINGDALPDLFLAYNNTNKTYINNGNGGWINSPNYASPITFNSDSWILLFRYHKLVDINGDGLNDLVAGDTQGCGGGCPIYFKTYLNTSSGWQLQETAWQIPFTSIGSNGVTNDPAIIDVNGDGLPDLVRENNNKVYLNNGNGWNTSFVIWNWPESPTAQENKVVDLNNDGIIDFLISRIREERIRDQYGNTTDVYNILKSAWLGKGDGTFVVEPNYISPVAFSFNSSIANIASPDLGVRIYDYNGDGLQDLVQMTGNTYIGKVNDQQSQPYYNATLFRVYLNTGIGWSNAIPIDCNGMCPNFSNGGQSVLGSGFLADFDGNNKPDFYNSNNSTVYKFNETQAPVDRINRVNYSFGSSSNIFYKPTVQYKDAGNNLLNPKLFINIDTVKQVTTSDGLGSSYNENYSYEGGKFNFINAFDRRLSGFNRIKQTDASGNILNNFYHQGDSSDAIHGEYNDEASKIGKVYRTELTDSSGNIYSKTINKWDSFDLGNGRKFVKLAQSVESTYDGDASHKDKASSMSYDNTSGNLTQKIEYGEVTGSDDGTFTDTGTDKFTTDISYALNTGANILGLPSQSTTTDQSANKVKESKFYYDTQSLGSVTKGNLTKKEDWKSSSSYVSSQKTYDPVYGTVASDIDARGKITTYSNDSYNLYPATVTNPLAQVTSYIYDYSSGKPKQVTDVNSRVFQTVYDGLDRVIEEKQPDQSTPENLVTKTTYTYTDTPGAVRIQKTDYLDATNSVDSYVYFDGLNRPVQSRKEMEDANIFAVTDTVYNNLGQVHKESLAYASTGSAKTNPTTTAELLMMYTYDPVMRVANVSSAVGNTSNAYNDWKLTITDPRGKTKDLYKDAYGNLVRVDEHEGPSTYSTYYEYDGNNNLKKIIDALGNIRSFTYNGLGQRLTAQDLHATADATFGTWTYTYDDAGNVTQVVDPKNQTINYTYDDLNRQLTENYTGLAGTEVTNTYDTGTDGIGRLSSIATTGANTAYVYNALGKLKQETKTINAVNYPTDYTYDRQGNNLEITNPDGSQVKYTYNIAGELETVQRKETTDGAFINVVTDFDYGPHGKVTYQANANGTATTNTYDATKLYRLSNRQTSGPGGAGGSPTTVTFYPSAGDGSIYHSASPWSTVRSAASGSTTTYTAATFAVRSGKSSSTNYRIERAFFPFNTSSLPDNAIISSAKLKVFVESKLNNDNDGDDWVSVVQGSQPSTTSLTTSDYDLAGSVNNPTEGIDSSERKDITNVTTGQYLIFNLNTAGKSWISKTGSTKLALREGHDVINSSFTGTTGQYDQLTIRSSEYTGTASDPILEITYTDAPPAPTVIQNLTYTYDNNGNVLTIVDASATDTAKTSTYAYDDLNRLTSATVTGAVNGDNTTKTYAYDAIGNILNSTDKGAYVYAGTNFANPHAATSIGGVTHSYDNNGNLTSNTLWTNTWDYNNNLTQSQKSGTTVIYTYDQEGQRVKLANGTTTTYYPSRFYNTDGTTVQKHIFAGGVLVATVKGTGAAASVTTDHTDHLTGTGPVSDNNGGMVQLLDYHPYGTFRIDWKFSTVDEQRKFAGQEFDRDTELSYMNARYYSPVIGRFISVDPMYFAFGSEQIKLLSDPQMLNSYSYARNNPLAYIDPDGHIPQGLIATVNFLDHYNPLNYYFAGSADKIYEGGRTGDWGLVAEGTTEVIGNTANIISTSLEIGMTGGTLYGIGAGVAMTKVANPSGIKQVNDLIKVLQKIKVNSAVPVSTKISSGLKVGEEIPSLGKVIEKASGKINGFNHDGTFHGLDQIISRGVNPQTLSDTVSNPLVRFAGRYDRTGYLSKNAYIVLDKAGQVVTAIGKSQFKSTINNVLKSVK